jgi:hypothetical protein
MVALLSDIEVWVVVTVIPVAPMAAFTYFRCGRGCDWTGLPLGFEYPTTHARGGDDRIPSDLSNITRVDPTEKGRRE